METMKQMAVTVGSVVVVAWFAVLMVVLVVTTFDPACGPDGYSQTACLHELAHDARVLATNAVDAARNLTK